MGSNSKEDFRNSLTLWGPLLRSRRLTPGFSPRSRQGAMSALCCSSFQAPAPQVRALVVLPSFPCIWDLGTPSIFPAKS